MFFADTLSRAFLPAGEQDESEFETINMIKYLQVSEERLLLIQLDTEVDSQLTSWGQRLSKQSVRVCVLAWDDS